MNETKIISKICFKNAVEELRTIKTSSELITFKLKFFKYSKCFGVFEDDLKMMLKNKEHQLELDSNKSNVTISDPTLFEPLNFNLQGLDTLEDKINKLNDFKLKYEFKGLLNLLSDSCNLIYNPLWIRQQIIKDLNKFKSLKFFKVNYLSRYDLKREYRKLSYKNNADIGHSKLYFIKKGLYVLKTLKKDDISLKVFYVGNRYKTLLKTCNTPKRVLKGDKYNLSSTEAYKVLDKKDSIKYYTYCNTNGLDKKNRQLLRDIRKSKRMSCDSLIESLEDKMEDLKDSIDNKVLSETERTYLELQFQDAEKLLSDLKSHDEDNSIERETYLSDYF